MKNVLSAVCAAMLCLWCVPAHAEKCQLEIEVPGRVSISGSVAVIFHDEQCFGVYEGGRIAYRNVYQNGWYVRRALYGWASTGSDAHATPLSDPSQGPQRVLRSSRDHRSKEIQIKVDGRWIDAPMPFALFFDEKGRAIHAGNVRSERASHGCVRIPIEAAHALFDGFDHRSLKIIIARNRHEFREKWEGDAVVEADIPRDRYVQREFRWNGFEFFPQLDSDE